MKTTRPYVVVAIANQDERDQVAHSLLACGCDVVAVASGYHLVQHLSDALFDVTIRRPDLILVGPKLAGCQEMTVLVGLRDCGWTTPFLFLLDPSVSVRLQDLQDSGVVVSTHAPFDAGAISEAVMRRMRFEHGEHPAAQQPDSAPAAAARTGVRQRRPRL